MTSTTRARRRRPVNLATLRGHLHWRTLHPHRRALRTFLEQRVADRSLVEDLHQETLLRAVGSGTAVERLRCPRAWLLRVAGNVMRDHFRVAGVRPSVPLDDAHRETLVADGLPPGHAAPETLYVLESGAVTGSQLGGALGEVWARLPPRDRDVVHAHYFEGVSVGEVGERYGAPPGTTKVWLHRARKRLRGLIDARLRSGRGGLDAEPWEREGPPRTPWERSA